MGKGPPLTDIEKGQILAFDESNMNHREIARRVNRSTKVVSNFLRDPAVYGTKYKPGRARALNDRGRHRLFDEVRKTGSSARKLQPSLQLTASVRTTQRALQQNCNDLAQRSRRTERDERWSGVERGSVGWRGPWSCAKRREEARRRA